MDKQDRHIPLLVQQLLLSLLLLLLLLISLLLSIRCNYHIFRRRTAGLVAVLSVIYGSVSVVAVVGNLLVIIVVAASARMRTVTNYFRRCPPSDAAALTTRLKQLDSCGVLKCRSLFGGLTASSLSAALDVRRLRLLVKSGLSITDFIGK